MSIFQMCSHFKFDYFLKMNKFHKLTVFKLIFFKIEDFPDLNIFKFENLKGIKKTNNKNRPRKLVDYRLGAL